jgi:acetoin utilization deacetylase AcuC-like enzyme
VKKVGFIYDDIFLLHATPAGHPESKERLITIRDTLTASDLWKQLIHVKPRRAGKDDILSVHTEAYYREVMAFTGYYDADTYISKDSVEAAHYAAGGVIEAVERCSRGELDRAFCAVRPPGHHAEADRAMGFCIFNNVAVGARYARRIGYDKVLIVDFDAHHGNGTQHIFEEDDTVYYFSAPQFPHYPGTGRDEERGRGKGKGFTYNIPMRYGSGDKEYFSAFHDLLPGVTKNFGPDIILVSAGYDLHARDPLAGLRVTREGIRSIVKSILLSCRGIPHIFCLEGGYHLPSLRESVVLTIEELLRCS